MSNGAAPEVLVIGIGNPDRADDGIGPLVAQRLARLRLPGARVLSWSADALAMIDEWGSATTVVLVDAALRQSAAGTVHRIDALTEALPGAPARPSTHAFGVAEAISLARVLQVLPRRLILYAVEAERFTRGAPMSVPVAAAAEELVTRIAAEVSRLTDA